MKVALLRRVLLGYFANDCPPAAAAIAYYVLLSIFPLILLVLTVGSYLLRDIADYSLVYRTIGAVIVLLVWAYATASILLLGGQLAKELDAQEAGEVAANH